MKPLLAGRMVLCNHCGLAFVVKDEGDTDCDSCIESKEAEHEIVNSGELMDFYNDE